MCMSFMCGPISDLSVMKRLYPSASAGFKSGSSLFVLHQDNNLLLDSATGYISQQQHAYKSSEAGSNLRSNIRKEKWGPNDLSTHLFFPNLGEQFYVSRRPNAHSFFSVIYQWVIKSPNPQFYKKFQPITYFILHHSCNFTQLLKMQKQPAS